MKIVFLEYNQKQGIPKAIVVVNLKIVIRNKLKYGTNAHKSQSYSKRRSYVRLNM